MFELKGVYTALITPFKDDFTFDREGFCKNLERQACVDGLVALGTTGESPTLSDQEQVEIIRLTKEFGKPLIVGTGSNSTEKTIRMSRLAEEMGADACLVIVPYYNKPTQEGVARHFEAVADALSIPVIVYHHPGRTSVTIEPSTLKRLSSHSNIIGIKESSTDFSHVSNMMEACPPNFAFVSGCDETTFPMMALGGKGVISVASNFGPEKMKQLVDHPTKENHFNLMPLFRALCLETNPIPIKTVMNQAGLSAGPCRLPLCPMQPENTKKLQELLAHA